MRLVVLSSFLAAISLLTPDARACGGCFHEEPTITPVGGGSQSGTVVTDHRILLALSSKQSTLWDQVRYAGDPGGFAWVLPIHGKVKVGVGDDGFLEAIDQLTAPRITGPTLTCVQSSGSSSASSGDYSSGGGCGAMSDSAHAPSSYQSGGDGDEKDFDIGGGSDGVEVTARTTVGPYETVQIHGTDEDSITDWLRKNHYEIPTDIEPTLAAYVSEGFDFLAVRLKPGADVNSMRPIRVTFPGTISSLPLRMVKAGVGARVGMLVMVIGDGRWKTASIPTTLIDRSLVSWDFESSRSNYAALRDKAAGSFVLESSVDVWPSDIPVLPPEPMPLVDTGVPDTTDASDAELDASSDTDPDASSDAEPEAAADSSPDSIVTTDAAMETDPTPMLTDLDLAFDDGVRRVTRLRADLPASALTKDLTFTADDPQYTLPREIQVTDYTHFESVCPKGSPKVKQPAATPTSSSNGCMCTMVGGGDVPPVAGALAAVLGATIVRRRRRRAA